MATYKGTVIMLTCFFYYNKNAIFGCGECNINLLNHGQSYLTDNFHDILHSYILYVLYTKPIILTIKGAHNGSSGCSVSALTSIFFHHIS